MVIKNSSQMLMHVILLVLCIATFEVMAIEKIEVTAGQQKDFVVYDGTLYADKPELGQYGIISMPIIYASWLWSKEEDRASLPSIGGIKAAIGRASPESILCIDIEEWPVRGAADAVNDSVKKYSYFAVMAKRMLPNVEIGYYGVLPIREYWSNVSPINSNKYNKYLEDNERMKGVAEFIDVVFPSLYTFYDDDAGWVKYAERQLMQAKKYDKKVIAFLWPFYHESNFFKNNGYIGDDYWMLQLKTVYRHADGVVIWGGWNLKNKHPMRWSENAPWWRVTKGFLEDIN